MTYRPDPYFLGYLVLLIHIDLVEFNSSKRQIVGELLENRRDHSTWPTPRSPKVDDDGLVSVYLTPRSWSVERKRIPSVKLTTALKSSYELKVLTGISYTIEGIMQGKGLRGFLRCKFIVCIVFIHFRWFNFLAITHVRISNTECSTCMLYQLKFAPTTPFGPPLALPSNLCVLFMVHPSCISRKSSLPIGSLTTLFCEPGCGGGVHESEYPKIHSLT